MKIKYYFNDDEFLYEPAYEDVENAIVNFMIEDCENVFTNCDKVGAEQMAKFVVYRLDLFDELVEQYEELLAEYFEDEALEHYKDEIAYEKDKDDWFGTKRDILG